MKRIIALASALPLMLGISVISADEASASADTSCAGVDITVGTGTCSDVVESQSYSAAHSSTSASVTDVNGVDIHSSTTVLASIKATGMTKAQKAHAPRVYRLKKAMWLLTNYKAYRNGVYIGIRWHKKWYAKGHKFYKEADHRYHDGPCDNTVLVPISHFHVPRSLIIRGSVKLVASVVFGAHSSSSISDSVVAKSMAWAHTDTCSAFSQGSGSASFYASASASFSGSVRTTVLEKVRGMSQQNLAVKLQAQSVTDVHGTTVTEARGNAVADAVSFASCSGPNVGPPSITSVETVNDVLLNNTRTIRVTGTVPAGRFATLFANACNGGSIVADNNQTVSGTFDVTVTYKAPSEVPGVNTNPDCAVSAGKDRVNFTLTDTANSTLKDTSYTTFNITQPVPDSR